MKLERLLFILDGYSNPEEVANIYIREEKYEKGQDVKWSEELQGLADKDESIDVEWIELKCPHIKYAICPRCKLEEYVHGDDGRKNKYCGNCGQKINYE